MGAKWILKEKIGKQRSLVILFSFILAWFFMSPFKVLLMNQSHNLDYKIGFICILLSTFLFAGAKLTTRKLAHKGESPKKLTTYLLILIVPFSFIPALFVWITPSLIHLPWLALGGLLTVLAIYSVSMALSYAEISFLAPFDFIQFILNALLGYWVFTELPSSWAILMIIAMIFGSLATLIPKFKNRHIF